MSSFLRVNGHSFDERAGESRNYGKRRCYDTPIKASHALPPLTPAPRARHCSSV